MIHNDGAIPLSPRASVRDSLALHFFMGRKIIQDPSTLTGKAAS